ncbi:MAG TPA: hypothetical protein VK797_12030 [Tepidisphaeraceae bacterium]|jgi:hypothetical protein|nr:hypothetical protein [Tepidisphaeraceae bacterium]
MPKTLIVFSADPHFFPLAKGLVLSLKQHELARHDIGLAFVDNGCSEASLRWLVEQGVVVRSLAPELLGNLATAAKGYLRSIVCRPLLPRVFPDADVIVWLDSDLWVQVGDVLPNLSRWAQAHRDKIFICPEWHYSYSNLNENLAQYQIANLSYYYRATYGTEVAREMSSRPTLNCGVFAMAAENPLWDVWWNELRELYARPYGSDAPAILHMAEQIAMNVLAHRRSCSVPVDPLYNYMCMWGTPFRDNSGIVRVALPPASIIGIVHLSLWKNRRRFYYDQRLLYQSGNYLTEDEKRALLE